MPGTRTSRAWFVLLVPAIAALVAAGQVVVATTTELTPWRGAGFGMFSTVDNHDTRLVRVVIVDGDGRHLPSSPALLGSSGIHDAYITARAYPSERHLQDLGERIRDADPVVALEDAEEVVVPSPERVIVEVLAVRFEVETGLMTWRSLGRQEITS